MTLTDFLLRIGLAVLLGFIIGLERQITGHLAGIRTNILVCMGACMFTLFSFLVTTLDMTRIAAQVVTGISFLCSGIIIKDGVHVRGIDTAATIWCTAGIGVLASSGYYLYAAAACAVIVFINIVVRPLIKRTGALTSANEADANYTLTVTCADSAESVVRTLVKNSLPEKRMHWRGFEVHNTGRDAVRLEMRLFAVGRQYDEVMENIVSTVVELDDVAAATWQNS